MGREAAPRAHGRGALAALLNRRDIHHAWVLETLKRCEAPLIACEAVLSEAAFLIQRDGRDPAEVAEIAASGAIRVEPVFPEHAGRVAALMRKYADVPMSLADACLVVLAERHAGDRPGAQVLTLDTDFQVYRMHGRRRIPLLAPFA
ncbi:MAG TPA: PIN domain-containing protein [Rubricoccaceae bacterium]|nr:PIN domain-containing protein [Rubricoccaceae bacterium]